MEPEKKKKLDEIKRRKKLLQEQYRQSEQRKVNITKSVEEEAKEALKQASKIKVAIESDELINKSQNNIMKYIRSQRIQDLATTNFNEYFPAFKPEVYEEGTQWSNLKKEDDEEEDSENDEKGQVQEKPKVPLIVKKNKQVKNQENKNVNKEYIVTNVQEDEKYIKAHAEEIDEFLLPQRKYMERAIYEKDIYNMFLNDDYEYPTSLSDSNNLVHPILF